LSVSNFKNALHGNLEGDMKKTNSVHPCLIVMDRKQIKKVHEYSLQILSSIGLRVDSPEARKLFAQAIGSQAVDGDRVRIPADLVEWAIQAAPAHIDIYDRNGAPAFRLPDQVRFGVGVTALYYQDPATDEVTPFNRQHMAACVRLGNRLPSFDAISTIGIVQDVAPQVSDLYATLEMTANTDKPIIILISEEDTFPLAMDLLEHLHGDLASRPSIIPYFNPITPLVINKSTVDKMFVAIERGLPFIYANYGMAGASTPITPAGQLALMNAEVLAGLTLGQLIKEGTPMILGNHPACFDMKGNESFYDPKSYLIDLASAEMMAHYSLPHSGTSGSGMGWGADLIAGGHQWFNHLISCLGKKGLAPFVGDILGSQAFSPNVIVYANEVIQQARQFTEGFVIDDTNIGLEDIAQVGPGGNFLTSNLTLKFYRNARQSSHIFDNLSMDEWQARGRPQAEDLLKGYTRQLLDESKPPENHSELLAQGESFIEALSTR
jgi:trimethylamine--corrinoid protein Co-methyltransferase